MQRGAPPSRLDSSAWPTHPASAIGQELRDHWRKIRARVGGSNLRRRYARRRAAAAAVGLIAGFATARTLASARTIEAAWGPRTVVVVAATDLRAGRSIDDTTTRREEWPTRLLPAGVLRAAVGDRLARPVPAGAAVTTADLVPSDGSAVAAQLNSTTVGIAIARGDAPIPLRSGDHVDVYRIAAESDTSLTARRIAVRALVVATDPRTATVAVHRRSAGSVAGAAATGTATMVLVP
ncbi:MAG: SAF domain-containing protein [Actinomycetes bacterium]